MDIPPKPRPVMLTVKIEARQLEEIQRLQDATGRNRSDIVRRLLDTALPLFNDAA